MTAPRCTYRVQLRPGFGFREATGILDQLARLGASHLYLSPVLAAVPASEHGYDVIDHSRVNEELGSEQDFADLSRAARERGMGILLDIVPNHMAIHPLNRWWWDVLENGRSSLYALFFDISWDPPEPRLKDLILVPALADHYGRVLEAGALRVEREAERIVLRYQDHLFPLAPPSLGAMVARAAERIGSGEATSVASALAQLPDLEAADRDSRLARHHRKEEVMRRLARLCSDDIAAPAIDREVSRVNGDADELDALLRRQHYRLAHWRTASRELDYRRFFDINELVGLRVEDPVVFDAVHERVIGWLGDGTIEGVRVDHVDGLRDPKAYLERLRAAAPPGAWIVVEKILHRDERLRPSWPADGTTGYDGAELLTRLFVDPSGVDALTETYRAFTGGSRTFEEIAIEAKHDQMRGPLAADVERVTALLVLVCERHRRQRDHTRADLREAIREVAGALAVYRTYARAEAGEVEDEDGRWIDGAIGIVRRRRPEIDTELLRFIRSLVMLGTRGEVEGELVMRFQQLCAPVAAKGVEDTAFYRYARLTALNDVGADPGRAYAAPDELHRSARERLARWPRGLLPGSTHDSKRSQDVRARIALLSEIPQAWSDAVARWSRRNERHRTGGLPDREVELLYYQTLIGAHPLPLERALAYIEKAAREAKRQTSWTSPNEGYERALAGFVRGTLADETFTEDLAAFCRPIVEAGRIVSLAQTLIALTLPGIPDIYQGNELWDLSLVDPDDRRAVDFAARARLLAELDEIDAEAVLARADEGLPKLHVISRALRLRAERPDIFAAGAYEPLAIDGERAAHAIGYARGGEVAVVVPRFPLRLAVEGIGATVALPEGEWCDRLTGAPRHGGRQRVADLLDRFPVALLARA